MFSLLRVVEGTGSEGSELVGPRFVDWSELVGPRFVDCFSGKSVPTYKVDVFKRFFTTGPKSVTMLNILNH